jgi:DNA-binding transcriptional ArsR family regulator
MRSVDVIAKPGSDEHVPPLIPKDDRATEPDLLDALAHPIRLAIMRTAATEFSPKTAADALGDVSLQLVSYHVRILHDAGLLTPTRTEPRRGAVEHFYRAAPEAAGRLRRLGAMLTDLSVDLGGHVVPRRKTSRKRATTQ